VQIEGKPAFIGPETTEILFNDGWWNSEEVNKIIRDGIKIKKARIN
jgi:hypothetical protein